ncbi:hypothetical protein [Bacillus rubiinfantis]|uniref:hypothetical protein n=1 Tax=Bacillus rubiinfantis TaxID=1499680 RepID=UPI0005A730AA|nr:hypothetical protein [Bacillus rubiinfantis]
MNKKNFRSKILFIPLSTVIISISYFLIARGPNADIYTGITVFGTLSILGIVIAIVSGFLTKRFLLPIIGILGNGLVLVFAFLLLLAMGIGEP